MRKNIKRCLLFVILLIIKHGATRSAGITQMGKTQISQFIVVVIIQQFLDKTKLIINFATLGHF